jgi:hypothetical protein
MKATRSSETSIDSQRTRRRYTLAPKVLAFEIDPGRRNDSLPEIDRNGFVLLLLIYKNNFLYEVE